MATDTGAPPSREPIDRIGRAVFAPMAVRAALQLGIFTPLGDGPMSAGIPTAEGWPQQSEMKLRDALSGVAAHARRDLAAIKLAHLIPVAGE